MTASVVTRHKVVAITYSILDESGVILETSDIQVYYVHGGPIDMFTDVEVALDGCELGDSVEVVLPPEKAVCHPDPANSPPRQNCSTSKRIPQKIKTSFYIKMMTNKRVI